MVFIYREEEKSGYGQKRYQILAAAALVIALPLVIIFSIIFWFIKPLLILFGIFVGLAAGALFVFLKSRSPEIKILDAISAHPADENEYPRFVNLVSNLSLNAGVAIPDCYYVRDSTRNGMAVAGRNQTAIVLTSGLLECLNLIESEGVIAELLVRVKSGDAADATLASALFGVPIIDKGFTGPLRYLAEIASDKLLDKDRELRADREAIALTRYPSGLRDALLKMEQGDIVTTSASEGTDYLWLVPPSTTSVAKNEETTRASIGLRIDVLSDEI